MPLERHWCIQWHSVGCHPDLRDTCSWYNQPPGQAWEGVFFVCVCSGGLYQSFCAQWWVSGLHACHATWRRGSCLTFLIECTGFFFRRKSSLFSFLLLVVSFICLVTWGSYQPSLLGKWIWAWISWFSSQSHITQFNCRAGTDIKQRLYTSYRCTVCGLFTYTVTSFLQWYRTRRGDLSMQLGKPMSVPVYTIMSKVYHVSQSHKNTYAKTMSSWNNTSDSSMTGFTKE